MQGVICLDTETTGLNRDGRDEVLQLAAVSFELPSDGIDSVWDPFSAPTYSEFNRFYGTRNHIDWRGAERFHHISPSQVYGKPTLYDDEARREASGLLSSPSIIIGYNSIFDLEMLDKYCIDTSDKMIYDVMYSFTEYYSRKTGAPPRHFKLKDCAIYFGRTFESHDALEDAKATLFVWRRLMDECGNAMRTYSYNQLTRMRDSKAPY